MMQGGREDVEFLARSKTRVDIMEVLSREEEMERDDLRRELDASRTTIQRNLDALEERGWIENGNREYAIQSCGEIVARDFLALVESVDVAEKLQPILRYVDHSRFDFDLRLLSDATVLTPEPGNPRAMENRHVKRIEETEHARKLLPLTGLHAVKASHDRIVNHGAEMELVVSPDVATVFNTNRDFVPYIQEMAATDRYTVFCATEELPFYLGILDETVQIGVDEDGEPRALLETENRQVRQWAKETFESYRRESQSLTVG